MKALVVFSGGLDSTTVLAQCIKDFGKENVYAISFFYGQRHRVELDSVLRIIRYYGMDEDKQLFMPDISGNFVYVKNPLIGYNGKIPEGTYKEQGDAPATEVPFRNGVFLSIASSVAMANGIDFVYCGIHQDDDRAAYADTSVEFFDLMRFAISSGTHRKVALRAPFVNCSKDEIVMEGRFL